MAENKDESGCYATLIFVLYVVTFSLASVPLHSNNWVLYHEGYSGLWRHCNTTDATPTMPEKCEYIAISIAPGYLHMIRALYITGYIIFLSGGIYRFFSWKDRGTEVDYKCISGAFVSSALLLPATLVFHLVFFDQEFASDPQYKDPRLSSILGISYSAAVLSCLLGVANTRHHVGLRSSKIRSHLLLALCCILRKKVTSPRPSTRHSTTAATNTTNEAGRQGTSAATAAPSAVVISVVAGGSRENSSAAVAPSRNSNGGSGSSSVPMVPLAGTSSSVPPFSYYDRNSRMTPIISGMPAPPSYEDVIGDQAHPDVYLPEVYNGSRDLRLVLSPPPAYTEKP